MSEREERDSMGSVSCRKRPLRRADPAGGGKFSRERPHLSIGLYQDLGTGQEVRGRSQSGLGCSTGPLAQAIAAGGAGSRRGQARPPFPAGYLPDRLRHLHQHERQRGHRQPRHEILGGRRGDRCRSIPTTTSTSASPATTSSPRAIHIAALGGLVKNLHSCA